MKNLIVVIFSLFVTNAFSQGEYGILQSEMTILKNRGIDTIYVFGRHCIECMDASDNKFYLCYDSVGITKVKMIYVHTELFDHKKTFDSSFICRDCQLLIDYGRNNCDSIMSQLSRSRYLMAAKTVVGNKTFFSVTDDHGVCYHTSLFLNGDWEFAELNKQDQINNAFRSANYYWILYNLMKNQWPNL